MILNQKPKITITELADENMSGDVDGIRNYLIPVTENLDMLMLLKTRIRRVYFRETYQRNSSNASKNVQVYCRGHRYNFEDTTLAVLDSADRIYYVATMDLLAIKTLNWGSM